MSRPAASYQREIQHLQEQVFDLNHLRHCLTSENQKLRQEMQDMKRHFEIADRIFKIRTYERPESCGRIITIAMDIDRAHIYSATDEASFRQYVMNRLTELATRKIYG
jgi:hypothetical protein